MTIKRQWLIVLILSVVLSVVINTVVLGSLINRYFVNYTTTNYEKHYSQIVESTKKALLEKNFSSNQLALQLETHLSDPINGIQLYDAKGNLLIDVSNTVNVMRGMMNSNAMNQMMGSPSQEIDTAELKADGKILGTLRIVKYSSIGNSLETRMFAAALIENSLLSFALVLVIMLVIGSVISKRMSKDLMKTAEQAINIDLGNQTDIELSKVREISTIQQSLKTLQSRLKLRQTSRKKLIDELVHQTRTPLTILKTHLEGFEDGIINMTPDEIKTCEAQIDNITTIIANMSRMIDADKEIDRLNIEEFEINQLLRQIIGGLKLQFDKKNLELSLLCHQKVYLKTDKYKLSQCIYNIITNSYNYTEPGGKVTVSYDVSDHELIIKIEDSGPGISEEDKKHLFEAYFRGTNTAKVGGEGIGLYVVKENLDRMKGTITVDSEIGKGSRFVIRMPKN